jgi:hypothetical protein
VSVTKRRGGEKGRETDQYGSGSDFHDGCLRKDRKVGILSMDRDQGVSIKEVDEDIVDVEQEVST